MTREFAALLGFAPADLVGANSHNFHPPELRAVYAAYTRTLLESVSPRYAVAFVTNTRLKVYQCSCTLCTVAYAHPLYTTNHTTLTHMNTHAPACTPVWV